MYSGMKIEPNNNKAKIANNKTLEIFKKLKKNKLLQSF